MNLKVTTKSSTKGENGNCLAAAFASILDIEIADVPKFEEMTKTTWKKALFDWASSINVEVAFTNSIPNGFCIGIGVHDSGEYHAVILRDGDFYFDTNGTEKYYVEHKYCITVNRL
jgi:hypothetical protein|tara:strand:+ start:2072 stop:2419 length:348 start_codon:yes stop_codon:yes gene_type:complete